MPAEDMIVVARLGSPYGLRGWLHLQSYTSPPANVLDYQPWYIQAPRGGAWRPLGEPPCRAHKKGFVTRLSGIADRDMAAAITGSLVGVRRDALPAPAELDEYYWRDLVGCRVINESGVVLGEVDRLLETGAHDVLVVARAGAGHAGAELSAAGETEIGGAADAQVLIPFAAEFVAAVDTERRIITVNWDASW